MANNKLNKPKPSETMDTLGAKMRRSNNCHDGEMQMLIAIGEALGMKMTFNEKEGTVTVEKDENFCPTETEPNLSLPQSNPAAAVPVSYTLDKEKLLDYLKPVVSAAIKDGMQNPPAQSTATVDRNILLANNDTTMQLVDTKWSQWFDRKKAELQSLLKLQIVKKEQPKREVAFRAGDDVVYKVSEEELYGPDIPSAQSAPSEENTRSLFKRLLHRLYEDMISCWWKAGAYILCFCSLTCSCYLGYKNYRMTNIVKEYGILKPALMHHRDFRDFMKSLDEVLNEDDIEELLKRLEDREKKSK